jgi:hypothetical protein
LQARSKQRGKVAGSRSIHRLKKPVFLIFRKYFNSVFPVKLSSVLKTTEKGNSFFKDFAKAFFSTGSGGSIQWKKIKT